MAASGVVGKDVVKPLSAVVTRRARGSITRKALADAALSVADREGLGGVTIRAVASELGASAMSLYTHVANKEELFDLMFAALIERLVQVEEQPTWQLELERGCRHARAVLLAHPQWVPLLSRVAVPPVPVKLYDRMLALMVEDGFSAEATMLTVSAAMSFTIGLVLTERMLDTGDSPVPKRHLLGDERHIQSLSASTYPTLSLSLTTLTQWSFERVFLTGLESLVAGAERFRVQLPDAAPEAHARGATPRRRRTTQRARLRRREP